MERETTTTDDVAKSLSNTKEKVITLMSEKLDITKRVMVDETVITKKPVKETKTEQFLLCMKN